MPLITVIVPVYNSETTLSRCVNSILCQTYSQFELILINDGSTDSSGSICDIFATHDSRIKVFHKKNGGVSSARNIGISNMSGEWVTFVDSDDWVENAYLERMYNKLEDTTDLVIACANAINHPYPEHFVFPDHDIKNGEIDILFSHYGIYWRTSPWSKLFRTSIIKEQDLSFTEGMHIGEDAEFLYSYLLFAHEIVLSKSMDYNYVYDKNGNSLTKRINNVESELLSLNQIHVAINSLITNRYITNRIAINNLFWLEATYIRRVINSLYYNSVKIKTRILILKSLDVQLLVNFLKPTTPNAYVRFLSYLLKKQRYIIYDFIRIVISKLKLISI